MRKLLFMLFLTWLAFNSYAQSQVIKGKVTDEKGDPLPGVTVTLKNTQQRTVSNQNGLYTLNAVTTSSNVLTFSFIGYATKDVSIDGKATVDVKMAPESSSMNEVVVTALNLSREKKSLGYAVQGVNVNDMTEARAANITDLLDGKVAGLQLTTSGQSTGSTRVVLRGVNSLTGNNQPLWVVDGVPIDNTDSNGQVGDLDYGNNAADLNPDDIESIDVLKGPNAAALYGSKAANGAILVTTKKGKKNAGWGISVNSNYTASRILQFPYFQNVYGEGGNDVMSGTKVGPVLGQQYYQEGQNSRNWGSALLGQPILNFQGTALTTYSPHPENATSLYHVGGTYTQNISLSQADEASNIRFSYTRLDGNDVVSEQNLQKKNNFQLNAGKDFTKRLRIEARMQYVQESITNRTYRNENPANPLNYYNNALRNVALSDLIPWKDANGNAFANNGIGGYENPYWDIYENGNQDIHNTVIGGVTATIKIFNDLQFRAQESGNLIWGNRYTFVQKGSLSNKPGAYSEFQQNNKVWNSEGLFIYTKRLKDWSINASLGGNLRASNYYNTQANIVALAVHDVRNLANNAGLTTGSDSPVNSKVNSVYGLASIGYKGFLYLDVTGRNDWSSTLPAESRSFFYPSVSGSFVFSELLKKVPASILSYGKVRASIARVGNDTSPYNLLSAFNYGGNFNGLTYVNFDQVLKAANLKPEQTTSTEIGLELKSLNNRLSLDVSVYKSSSINQILTGATPAAFGFTSQVINAGEITNKGIELTISGTPVKTKNFTWDATLNYSANRNMVVSLSDGLSKLQLGGALTATVNAIVGHPIGEILGKDQAYSSDGKKLIIASSGLPYTNNNVTIGNYNPRGLASFGSTFRYKRVSFNFLVSGRLGGQMFSGSVFRNNTSGNNMATLEGREAWTMSNIILGEGGNAILGTTSLYNLPYPDASRQKGMMYPGYFPVLNTAGVPIVDAAGNMVADLSKPNTRWLLPQTYWQQTTNDSHLLMFDASYIKLTQVILGYSLPPKLLSKTVFKSAAVSLVGRNLWTILQKTPRGVDPQSAFTSGNAQGLEQGGALPYTTYGVDLKFSL